MKLQLSLCALLASTPVALGAFTPARMSPRAASTIQRPFTLEPLKVSPSNVTGSNEDSTSSTSNKEAQDVNPEAFAAQLDQDLEQLKKKTDPAMDAYTKALQDMDKNLGTPSPRSSTAGQGFGTPKAASSTDVDKKKAFMEKNRPSRDIPVQRDIIADQIMDQLESQQPPEKSPRDRIQDAKKAKEVPSATAKALERPAEAVLPPPPPPQPVVSEQKTYFPPTPLEDKPKVEPKKDEPVVAAKKTYFPPTPSVPEPKTVVPPKAKVEEEKTYFPPTPISKKPEPVVAKKEKTDEPKVVTPIAGKTNNPFVQPAAKVEAKKEEEKIDEIGSPSPVEAAVEQVKDKPRVVKTPPKARKTETKPKKQLELPKIELPKMEIPKVEIPAEKVEQAKELLGNAGGVLANAAQTVLKDGKGWALQVQETIQTARVEELDMTYEEAFQKMGKSGRGLVKIGSILVEAMRDAATMFADEFQKSAAQKRISSATKSVATPVQEVKSTASSSSSYLDQLQSMMGPTLGDIQEEGEKTQVRPKRRLNLRDIVLPEPEFDTDEVQVEPVPVVEQESVSVEEVQAKATEELNQIKSKAGSLFGGFLSSATSFVDDVKSRALEESEKLKASVGELKKKTSSGENKEDSAPKMSKTQPVGADKKKKKGGPFFFLDNQ